MPDELLSSVIKKDRAEVIILTDQYRIEGTVHLVPKARLTDFLNRPDNHFIPMTNVVVYSQNGQEHYRTDYLALNKTKITFLSLKI